MLMSDLHIGSPEVDYGLIKKDLKTAEEVDARILLNGDLFDAIVPSDSKRYRPDALHPRIRGRSDVLNETVTWAAELLEPYKKRIDLIGFGNHEDTVLKHHSTDLASMLVDRLGIQRSYGGYTGFVDYRFVDDLRHTQRYVIFYHHGAGGGASLGGSAAEFIKKLQFIDADMIFLGHRHFRITSHMRRLSCPLGGYKPRYKEVRYAMTGSYMDNWTVDRGSSRRASYAEDRGLPPLGKGGILLTLGVSRSGITVKTEIE